MANLSQFLVLLIIALPLANCDGKSLLNDGRSEAKLLRMHESVQILAATVRNLEIKSSIDGARLIHILNELMFRGEISLFELNQGVATIQNKVIHDTLAEVLSQFSGIIHEVQCNYHGPVEKLKESFAHVVEKSADGMRKIATALQHDDMKKELFAINQLRRMFSEATYAVFKLKLEFDLFHKTNKELEGEIDTSLEAFCKSLQNIKNDDAKAKDELVRLVQQLERVHKLAYSKLQNYVRFSDADNNTEIVKDVMKKQSGSFTSFSQLTSENREVAQLKTDFEKLYRDATGLLKRLVQCEVAEGTPGELYIRSTIFDGITLSKIGERELTELNVVPGTSRMYNKYILN